MPYIVYIVKAPCSETASLCKQIVNMGWKVDGPWLFSLNNGSHLSGSGIYGYKPLTARTMC